MSAFRSLSLCVGLLLTVGCTGEVRFEPDQMGVVGRRVAPGHAEQIETILTELFGTPAEPRVPAEPPLLAQMLDIDKLRQAAGPVASHQVGVTTGLYRRHCARCHGVTGDGRGPTALYQFPYPRDFRRGVFKFTSTPRGVGPTDDDLHATLMRGSPGTAMPSFKLLKQEERDALVEYVKYLSIRGQLEQELINFASDELDYNLLTGEEGPGVSLTAEADRQLILEDMLGSVVERWLAPEESVLQPPSPPAGFPDQLVDRGRLLFGDHQRVGCVKCHGGVSVDEDGDEKLVEIDPSLKDYDVWNGRRHDFEQQSVAFANEVTRRMNLNRKDEFAKGEIDARLREMRSRQQVMDNMLPPIASRPRRLGEQPLRGGTEPDDLFRHIQQGVDGTPMPAINGVLSDEDVWSLVAFVLSESEQAADTSVEPEP